MSFPLTVYVPIDRLDETIQPGDRDLVSLVIRKFSQHLIVATFRVNL